MDDLDHRNLGVQLKLWHLQDDAPGMVFWHPRGYAIYRVLEDYLRRKMRRAGYAEVRTPQLLPKEFWSRSGHWDKFREHMFRIDDGEQAMALKPMSCPCHVQVFNKGLRSWRELPIRYAEFGACHRNEPSGSLHGIMRTRAFEQDDAHVFCREQDVEREVAAFITLLDEVYRELGFPDYEVALSTRPAVRAGDDATWDWSEAKLGDAARSCGLTPHINPGEGAFYGPKLEFALRDRLGRSWQCGTVQLDGVLPQRLDASYIAPDGSRARPLMIHHAIFGSLGRMIAILLEHHGGVLPFWLLAESEPRHCAKSRASFEPIVSPRDVFLIDELPPVPQVGNKKMRRYIVLTPLFLQFLTSGIAQAAEASGAGSTFAAPIIEKWSAVYKAVSGDSISYQPVGSSIGVDMIKKAAVDFGTSDRPLSPAELKKLNMLQFPLAIGGVVPVVNIQGILPGQMRFTGPVLADIFLGKIRRWDHPDIRAINAELVLPNLPITVVHRLDGSGTTFNWTNYLSKVSTGWNTAVGHGNSVDWPLGLGGKGNNGVASLVAMVPGAIGYLEYSYALQKFDRISFGSVQNGSGQFAMPTVASFRAAAENADWKAADDFAVILADAPGADAYPIAATTYVLMPRKPAWSKSETSALGFLRWALEHGQAQAEALNYVPLPSKLVKQIEAYLDAGPAQPDGKTVAKGN